MKLRLDCVHLGEWTEELHICGDCYGGFRRKVYECAAWSGNVTLDRCVTCTKYEPKECSDANRRSGTEATEIA